VFVRARWRRRRYTARAPRHRRLPHLVDGAVLRDVAGGLVGFFGFPDYYYYYYYRNDERGGKPRRLSLSPSQQLRR